MCRLAKPKSNKANSLNLYPKTNGYFRETYKPQNINLISPTPVIKSFLVHSSIINLSVQFQYLTFQPVQESGVCKVEVFFFYVVLYFFHFN